MPAPFSAPPPLHCLFHAPSRTDGRLPLLPGADYAGSKGRFGGAAGEAVGAHPHTHPGSPFPETALSLPPSRARTTRHRENRPPPRRPQDRRAHLCRPSAATARRSSLTHTHTPRDCLSPPPPPLPPSRRKRNSGNSKADDAVDQAAAKAKGILRSVDASAKDTKKAAEKAAADTKKAVEKATADTKKVAEKAAADTKKAADKAAADAKKASKDIKGAAKEVKGTVKTAAKDIKRSFLDFGKGGAASAGGNGNGASKKSSSGDGNDFLEGLKDGAPIAVVAVGVLAYYLITQKPWKKFGKKQ